MNADGQRGVLENAMIVLPVTIVHSLVYRFLSFNSLFPPRLLESTAVDRWLPFLVWTIWPYLAMVGLSVAGPLSVRQARVFRMLATAYVISIVILLLFYLFLPTAIERAVRTAVRGSWTWFAYRQFTEGLGNGGCFPSGHIVFPMLACWALYRDRRRGAVLISGLTAAASVSILTTKEHVAWDWLGGIVVGAIAIAAAEFITSKYERQTGGGLPW